MNDNRNYYYKSDSVSKRNEYPIIIDWIPPRSYIIDLGCGDGSLLTQARKKDIKSVGIEISPSGIREAKKKGLQVVQGRIDSKLRYKNKEFDFAVCNVTLQMVMYPEVLLSEMCRIAKYQIVSFPNFAFFPNRLEMLLKGRMPTLMLYSYKWYSTGHIHQFSVADFEKYCIENNIHIIKKHHFISFQYPYIPQKILQLFPNIWSRLSIYLLEGKR